LNQSKLLNFSLAGAVLIAIFVWSTVVQNISASVESGGAKISFLDVGQGDATLISLPQNKQILIDTGKKGTLLEQLKKRMPAFDQEIEAVFLTHPDSDHIGSFESLTDSYRINKVYYNWDSNSQTAKKVDEIVANKKIQKDTPVSGRDYFFDSLVIETLWPDNNSTSLSDNNRSLVLKVKVDKARALLTGDIEVEGQNRLINKGADLEADLLKFPHHGSTGAYSEPFIYKVAPQNVIISVGPNSYGHPSKSVIEGLSKLHLRIFRTDELEIVDFAEKDGVWVRK